MKIETQTITENFVLRGQNVGVCLNVSPSSIEGVAILDIIVTVYADSGENLKFTGRGEVSVNDSGSYVSPPIVIFADLVHPDPAFFVTLTGDGFSYQRVWLHEIVINPVPIGHIDD